MLVLPNPFPVTKLITLITQSNSEFELKAAAMKDSLQPLTVIRFVDSWSATPPFPPCKMYGRGV